MTEPTETPSDARATPPAPSWIQTLISGPRLGTAAIAIATAALALAALPYATGGDFGGRVRAYLIAHPQVLDEVLAARETAAQRNQVEQARLAAEASTAAAQANPALLAVDVRDPAFGPADARVTVIEFFDFRCPGCKVTAPGVLQLMQDHPDVRFVFKDWPILDRPGEDLSGYAARAALAAHQQGRYLAVFEALMATPALDRAGVDRVLEQAGVNMTAARAFTASTDSVRHLADVHTAAAALKLQGTPTFFINGVASASIDPADIARAIEAAKAR